MPGGRHTVHVSPARDGEFHWSCTCGKKYGGYRDERRCRDDGARHQRLDRALRLVFCLDDLGVMMPSEIYGYHGWGLSCTACGINESLDLDTSLGASQTFTRADALAALREHNATPEHKALVKASRLLS